SLPRHGRGRVAALGLALALRSSPSADIIADAFDEAVGDPSPAPGVAEWQAHASLEEGYVAIVGRRHPLAARESVQLLDLAEEDWVTDDPPDSPWFGRIVSACRAAGFTPCVQINPPDFSTVLGFVATGDHVTVQPSLIAQDLRTDLVAVPIDSPALRRRMSVQVRRTLTGHP